MPLQLVGSDASEEASFEGRIRAAVPALSPSEQRVALCFLERREALVLGSASEIAALAGASDATVVRTARSLGFAGLADLREAALADLTSSAPTPERRLSRTLAETGDSAASALAHVVAAHEESLDALQAPGFEAQFAAAVDLLDAASRLHVFGIGPSGMMANYAALQFGRLGRKASALTASGVAIADGLLGVAPGDLVLMIAYAPIYREVAVTLDQAARLNVPVVLISDSLGPFVNGLVREILPVPRGRAGNLAMHGATLVVIEALITALASRSRETALASLEDLARLRGAVDRDWLKRGVMRKPPPK